MPVARWVLPVPGGPRKTTLSLAVTKSRVPRWAITSRLRPRAWSKSNSSRDLACGEPGRADPALPAVGLAGGDLALQAGGQELLVGPGLGPGPFGQAGHRLAQRGCLQRAGQERQLRGRVAAGVGCRSRSWGSSRDVLADAERGVVHRQVPLLDLLGAGGAGPVGGTVGQLQRRLVVHGVGDGLLAGPAPGVGGHDGPGAGHRDRGQVGDDVHGAPDHAGVHRVVVAVHAHVVIPRRGCQVVCVSDVGHMGLQVGVDAVGVGEGEGAEGGFPALDGGAFDELAGGLAVVAGG